MTAMATIRAADAGDVEGILAAYEWLFEPPGKRPSDWDPTRAAARVRRTVASDRSAVLLAEADGVLAGVATVYLDIESIRFGQRAWVEDLAVHPSYRSQGIGKLLLEAAKDWARQKGARRLELESGEARVHAHRFYMRELPGWRSICFGWELPQP